MAAAWQKLRWFIAYWISRSAIGVGRYLPTRLCYAVANPIANICFVFARRHRRDLIENLTRVVGADDADATARRVFRNYAKYVIDFYQLSARGPEALRKRIRFDEWQALDEVLDAGTNGTIFVTLHLGQAELGGAAMSTYRHPVNVIAETLPYEPMNDFVQGLRRSLGMKIIAAKKAKPEVLRSLARGEVMALMFDGAPDGQGVAVNLFGAPAVVSSTPARLAWRTGAQVLPAVVSRAGDDQRMLLPQIDFAFRYEPSGDEDRDVVGLTQALASAFEPYIRANADQWFAFSPVWREGKPVTKRPVDSDETPRWMQLSLRLGFRFGGKLPRIISYGLARFSGNLAYQVRGVTRRDVEDNMRHVLGPDATENDVRHHAKEVFRNVARYYVDLIRLPQTPPERLLNEVCRFHGFEHLSEPLSRGQGVVVATAHFGNPEMAVQVGSLLGLNILVLSEPLRPPEFGVLMMKIRTFYGARYEDVSFKAVANAMRQLRAGGALAITADRDIQGSGVPASFFGERARMPTGAVELAMKTGALLVPGVCKRNGDSFDLYFEEPIDLIDTGNHREDVLANLRQLIARIEPWIRNDPGQWLPLGRIWKRADVPPTPAKRPDTMAAPNGGAVGAQSPRGEREESTLA